MQDQSSNLFTSDWQVNSLIWDWYGYKGELDFESMRDDLVSYLTEEIEEGKVIPEFENLSEVDFVDSVFALKDDEVYEMTITHLLWKASTDDVVATLLESYL